MKKPYILAGVVALAVFLLALALLLSPGPGPVVYTAASSDGSALLRIPSPALPDGVSLDEITVTRIDDKDALGGVVTYAFAPDGLVFNSPVHLVVTLDAIGETIPELVHTSGETIESLEDVVIMLGPKAGTVTASAEISHFSEVKVIYPGFFNVSIVDPPALEYFIDETFSVTVKVQNLSDTIYYNATKQSGEKMIAPWSLGGTLKSSDETLLNPGEVEDVPKFGKIAGGSFETTQTFTCVQDGTGTVNYDIRLSGSADVYYSFDEAPRYDIWHSKQVGVSTSAITCKPLLLDTSAGPGTGLQLTSHDPDGLNCPDAKYLSVELGGFSKEVHKLKDGKCYPKDQFVPVSKLDLCKEEHYHVELRSLGQNVRSDSEPCGAAVKSDIVASGTVWITSEQINDIIDFEFERR